MNMTSVRCSTGEDKSEGFERGIGKPYERAPLAEAGGKRPDDVWDDPEDSHAAETTHLQDWRGDIKIALALITGIPCETCINS